METGLSTKLVSSVVSLAESLQSRETARLAIIEPKKKKKKVTVLALHRFNV